MVKVSRCSICGESHATPRQNKNCSRRNRRYSQSLPKASDAHVQEQLPKKFDESQIYVAYLDWKSFLEEE